MVKLLTVPYDSAHRDLRMGRGPSWLIEQGAIERLREAGLAADHTVIEPAAGFRAEIATAFELGRLISAAVHEARSATRFPLVVSGNCNAAIGTVSGLGEGTGILWFDAHADCETPDTTTSGFLDGMALATLFGRCWRGQVESISGFRPIPSGSAALVGTRQISSAESRLIEVAGISTVTVENIRRLGVAGALGRAIDAMRRQGVRQLYLHIDLDVHDPEAVGPANGFAEPGGLKAEEVREAVAAAGKAIPVVAAGIASFDPAYDRQ